MIKPPNWEEDRWGRAGKNKYWYWIWACVFLYLPNWQVFSFRIRAIYPRISLIASDCSTTFGTGPRLNPVWINNKRRKAGLIASICRWWDSNERFSWCKLLLACVACQSSMSDFDEAEQETFLFCERGGKLASAHIQRLRSVLPKFGTRTPVSINQLPDFGWPHPSSRLSVDGPASWWTFDALCDGPASQPSVMDCGTGRE